jgi:hypothetical protein
MGQPAGTVDEVIARLAVRTHGVITRRTLLEEGVTPKQIAVRLRRGSLLREHSGVYRVGHRAPSVEARYLAAVLACGVDSLLIARPAAFLWELVKGSPPRPEVVAPVKRRVKGVVTHRVRSIHPGDRAECRGVPVTSVARTVVDLAGLSRSSVSRGCAMKPRFVTNSRRRRSRSSWSGFRRAPGAARFGEFFTVMFDSRSASSRSGSSSSCVSTTCPFPRPIAPLVAAVWTAAGQGTT